MSPRLVIDVAEGISLTVKPSTVVVLIDGLGRCLITRSEALELYGCPELLAAFAAIPAR